MFYVEITYFTNKGGGHLGGSEEHYYATCHTLSTAFHYPLCITAIVLFSFPNSSSTYCSLIKLLVMMQSDYPNEDQKQVIRVAEKLMEQTMARYDPSHDAYHGELLWSMKDKSRNLGVKHSTARKKYRTCPCSSCSRPKARFVGG